MGNKTLSELLNSLVNANLDDEPSATNALIDDFWNYYQRNGRHNYHEVTEYILKNMSRTKEAEAISVIAENLNRILDELKSHCAFSDELAHYSCKMESVPFDCEKSHDIKDVNYKCYNYKHLYKFLLKLYDHIQLEFIRWSEIRKETTDLNTSNKHLRKRIDDTRAQQETLESEYWETFSNFEEIKGQTKEMYMQVISILGIFAAIVIAVFGGLNVISSISSAFLQGAITINRTILVSCMSTLFVLWVIFTLLGMIRWFRFKASPTIFTIIGFIVINIICLGGIVYAL